MYDSRVVEVGCGGDDGLHELRSVVLVVAAFRTDTVKQLREVVSGAPRWRQSKTTYLSTRTEIRNEVDYTPQHQHDDSPTF